MEVQIERPLPNTNGFCSAYPNSQHAFVRSTKELQTLRVKAAPRPKLKREFKDVVEALIGLDRRLRAYRVDNATNPSPVRIVQAADSAFGTLEVFQRLLELGYELTIKSYSGSPRA